MCIKNVWIRILIRLLTHSHLLFNLKRFSLFFTSFSNLNIATWHTYSFHVTQTLKHSFFSLSCVFKSDLLDLKMCMIWWIDVKTNDTKLFFFYYILTQHHNVQNAYFYLPVFVNFDYEKRSLFVTTRIMMNDCDWLTKLA